MPIGTVNQYKAQLVAKGYVRTHKTFAPMAKMATLLIILAVITIAKGWHFHQMDVKNDFLQGGLEEVYTRIKV